MNRKVNVKSFKFNFKEIDSYGRFEGYASVFGNKDSYGDIVEKGAFKRTLDHHKGRVPILWQHNAHEPIGLGLSASEDSKGLVVEGQLNMDVSRAVEARSLIEQGAIKGLSIGYSTIKDSWDADTRTNHLKEIKLWEYSPVTFPANELAAIGLMKSFKISEIEALLEQLKSQELSQMKNSDSDYNSLLAEITKMKNFAQKG